MTLLNESLHGFIFESNRGTRVTMTANSPLGPQFNFGWNNKKGKKFKTKNDVTKDKVSCIFKLLHTHFHYWCLVLCVVVVVFQKVCTYMYMCSLLSPPPLPTLPPLKVQALAQELQALHFSESQESIRKVASELKAILLSLEGACLAHENDTVS